MLSTATVLSRFVTHQIRRHRKKPRALVLNRSLSKCTHEGLLRYFLRPVAISQPPRQISHQRGVVRSEETFDVRHQLTIDPATLPDRAPTIDLPRSRSARSPYCGRRRLPARPRQARLANQAAARSP